MEPATYIREKCTKLLPRDIFHVIWRKLYFYSDNGSNLLQFSWYFFKVDTIETNAHRRLSLINDFANNVCYCQIKEIEANALSALFLQKDS